MESLYTKYRPQTFADVVGQTHVVSTLEHAVLEGRVSHAYLFCGPRGTGKTTMARLLAKALMCEQGEGHLPDGSCEQCRLIAAGEHPDVYELDAASRTGVDNVRDEIISRVSFAPVRGRYKMYIIDEVHMLTTAAFNALLKTLEEPPSHVVFVLCTTDPQKIPETILSRVQRFDFHAIGNADIQGRLAYICEREGFSYDPEALELVVRHARGGMRDAISELEQLSVSGGGTISVDVARDVLGEVSASTLERMSLAMANRDVPTLFAQVEGLVEVGRDLLQFTRALAARLRDVYVVAAIGAKSASVAAADADLPAISREAQAFESVDRIARALQLLSDASTEMRVAPNQRLVLEVALTKIARPQAELTLEALADRVATLERQVAALSAPARRGAQAPAAPAGTKPPAGTEREGKAAPQEAAERPVRQEPVGERVPQAQSRQGQPAQAAATQTRAPQAPAAQTDAAPAQRPAATQAPVRQAQAPAQQAPTQPAARQAQTPAASAAASPAPTTPAQEPAPASAPTQQAPASTASRDAGELQRRWKQVVDTLLATRPQHGSLLLHATLASDDGHKLLVSLPKGSGFACKMLDRADVRASLDPVIAQVFGPRTAHFAEADVIATIMEREGSGVQATDAPAHAATETRVPQQVAQAPAAPPTSPAPPARQAQAAPQASPSKPPARAQVTQQPQVRAEATQQVPPAAQAQQATRPQPSHQAQAPATAPSTSPAQAAREAVPAQQVPSYSAPWEPLPYDDDQVPYDDLDAAPYEEDFIFGTVDPAQMTPRAPQQPPAAPAPGAFRQQVRASEPREAAPQATPTTASAPKEPVAQAGTVEERPPAAERRQEPATASLPDTATTPPAPRPEPEPEQAPEPAPEQAPEPEPTQAPEPTSALAAEKAPAAPPAETEAPKRKRTSRQTGGIPNDIITMLSKVFGEGITYTELAPDAADASDGADVLAYVEGDLAGDDEFVDEPVDDADYDEEED